MVLLVQKITPLINKITAIVKIILKTGIGIVKKAVAKAKQKPLPVIALGIGLILTALFINNLKTQREVKKLKADLQKAKTEIVVSEIQRVTEAVGKLIILPEGEVPTFATVTDVEKLRQDQPFFNNAENGDKVLVYAQAKKAILYRPRVDKVVEVAPVNVVAQPTGGVVSAKVTPTTLGAQSTVFKVAIYNGTATSGLAKTVGDDLKANKEIGSQIEVVIKTNSTGDFTKTIVVDLSGNKNALASKIAQILDGSVGSLPEGEVKPEADILVIVGK